MANLKRAVLKIFSLRLNRFVVKNTSYSAIAVPTQIGASEKVQGICEREPFTGSAYDRA